MTRVHLRGIGSPAPDQRIRGESGSTVASKKKQSTIKKSIDSAAKKIERGAEGAASDIAKLSKKDLARAQEAAKKAAAKAKERAKKEAEKAKASAKKQAEKAKERAKTAKKDAGKAKDAAEKAVKKQTQTAAEVVAPAATPSYPPSTRTWPVPSEPAATAETASASMSDTIVALRAKARELSIPNYSRLTKAQLVERITAGH